MRVLSIEMRVGLLVLVAGVVLIGLTLALSGVQFGDTYTVYVDFDNAGSVQPGAPVRIAGMKVGSVSSLEFRGGRLDPASGRRSLLRMALHIEKRVKDAVRANATFFITAQGVLGEQFVAVDPGTHDQPALRDGAIVHGIDPPRLDMALALGYELLEALTRAVRNNREELGALLDNLGGIIRTLNQVLAANRDRLDHIVANVEAATAEASSLVSAVRAEYVDGPEVRRVLANLDRILGQIAGDVGPILADVRRATVGANEVLGTFGPEQRAQVQGTIASAAELAERASRTVGDAQQIVAHMRRGEGTVGAMLMDEELYDDLQEMIRDLKHNPWKFFWRE